MPLDQVARQYADTLLAREIEKVTREYQRIDQGIAQRFASNNSLRSGPSISATCDSKGDRIAAWLRRDRQLSFKVTRRLAFLLTMWPWTKLAAKCGSIAKLKETSHRAQCGN